MIPRAIALNTEKVPAWRCRICYGKIDAVARASYLCGDGVAVASQELVDSVFKRRIGIAACRHGSLQVPIFGIIEEGFQGPHAEGGTIVNVQLGSAEIGEDDASFSRPRDENVQTAVSTFLIKRSEVAMKPSCPIFAVADAEEDDIAFISLNRFQVFDEEMFVTGAGEEGFHLRMLPQLELHLVKDSLLLFATEGADSKAFVWVCLKMLESGLDDSSCFFAIGGTASPVVNRLWEMDKLQSQVLHIFQRRRKDEQVVVIKFLIGNGDERLVSAAIVPL